MQLRGILLISLFCFCDRGTAQQTIGFAPTSRSITDTANLWTMVELQGFPTDGVITGFNIYTQYPTSQRPMILGLYRPVQGSPCTFTLLKTWQPSITASNVATTITLSSSDQIAFKAGDTVGLTWTNYGNIPFDYTSGTYNYCDQPTQFTTIGGTASLTANRYGNRIYSMQAIYGPPGPCSSNPCQNGGTCGASANSYTCTCPSGYDGANCQNSYAVCSSSSSISSTPPQSIGYAATNRGVLDTAQLWTMVLNQGFTTAGFLTSIQYYVGAVKPVLLGLYRPVSGCTYTLIKSWTPAVTATGLMTLTLTGSDQVPVQVGDTIGYTWTNYGSIPFDYVSGQNYCENAVGQPAIGSSFSLVSGRYGNRAYSFQGFLSTQPAGPTQNYCNSKPCLNGGTCCSAASSFQCTCPAGTVAPDCATATSCSQNPCQNGATCVQVKANKYQCTCATGYTGSNCEVAPPPPTPCDSTPSTPAQPIGFAATNRGVLDTAQQWTMVLNQGFTTAGSLASIQYYVGAVRPVLLGLYRPVSGCTYTLIKSWTPAVTATGQMTLTLTGSDQVPVQVGDTIGYTWTNYGSIPFDYVSGQYYCENAVGQPAVGSSFSLVSGRYGNRAYSFQGFLATQAPVTVNYCVPNPCNTGTCCSTSASYQCTCPAGTVAPNCVAADPCASSPCANGGKCKKSGGSFTCNCAAGFTGSTCDSVFDPCASSPCANGGNCKTSGSSFTCNCAAGFTGSTCDTVFDPCASSPCANGGNCKTSGSSFTCNCAAGFTGSTCDTASDPCASSPCANGGNCKKSGSSFTCNCAAGFTGSTCDAATNGACASSPCQNGGVCTNDGSDYNCDCPDDYNDGDTCSIYQDPCTSSPCENGAKCTRLSYITFSCTCKSGYYGNFCELKQNTKPCDNKPCLNGGTCTDTSATTYSCKCPPAWEGSNCGTIHCLSDTTACTGLALGRYAYCADCQKFIACKKKKQKLKTCKSASPYFSRAARKCAASNTVCNGL